MKDVPDSWGDPDHGVDFIISQRNAFSDFAMRAAAAFEIAQSFQVENGLASTRITFIPKSQPLIAALREIMEPGETIQIGNQTWTVERCQIRMPVTAASQPPEPAP